MSGYAERMYRRYSEVRPTSTPPSCSQDLLAYSAPAFRRRFGPFLPARKDAAILDLGCGYGHFLYFLQSEGYTGTMGIDLNAQQLDIARNLGVRNIQCGQGQDLLRSSAGKFDFISALDVLEHVPKDQVLEFLDLVFAALRPGGRFLCQVPNLAAFYRPVFFMDFSHETPFTAPSLKQVLQLANFGNVRVLPMGPVVYGVKSAIRFVLWNIIEATLRFVQTVESGPGDRQSGIFTAAIFAVGDKA